MNLEQAAIQLLFDQGVLKKAVVTAVPMTKESFHVHFVSKDKVNVVCVKARTEIQREFKSLKGAANFVKEVGFKSFEVNL